MATTEKYRTGTDSLRATREGAVARLVLNNPRKHNALSPAMIRSLPGVLFAVADDPEARLLVIEGEGDRAFCSGADISSFADERPADGRSSFDAAAAAMVQAWRSFEKPIVAKIRGLCIGAGLLTALYADVRVATFGSRFGIPAARLGLGYEFSGVKQLVDVIGCAWASELLITARQVQDQEALQIGLVHHLVRPDDIESMVGDIAAGIAQNAPLTLRSCKVSIQEALKDPEQRDSARVQELYDACFQSNDYLEGQRAFLEKRPPRFVGR